MRSVFSLLCLCLLALLAACATGQRYGGKQNASVVDYLYPNAKEPVQLQPEMVVLKPPVRVGIAFVPGSGWGSGLPEAEKQRLLERVKASFTGLPYVGAIEVIPTAYLQPKGGFSNLEQVSRMFNVDVIALLSYDQVQFNDSNALSVLYWTIIGAYIVHGDQYDINTLLDASVFDVKSHKLLFRAPGSSQVKGSATMANFSEKSRAAQIEGYNKAVDQLVPNLQAELDRFRERIKSEPVKYKVENQPGYRGGGALAWLGLAVAAVLAALSRRQAQ